MGLFNRKKEDEGMEIIEVEEGGIIANTSSVMETLIKGEGANFFGEVENKNKKFPKDLGVEHQIDMDMMEGIFTKVGIVNGGVTKVVDFTIGQGFFVTSKNERAKEIIDNFMDANDFDTLLRKWLMESLVKGAGFVELGGNNPNETPKGIRVLDAKNMYVKRDDKGLVEGYSQYSGSLSKFSKRKVISFKPFQVVQFNITAIGDDAYGVGMIYPVLDAVDSLLRNTFDFNVLMGKKANSPYDVTMGKIIGNKYFKPKPEQITAFGKKLEWLRNKHEWVHDGLTEIKTLDFGNFGEKFEGILKYDIDMINIGMQIPEVLAGTAVNAATAPVQMDSFQRRIQSIQAEMEKVIEGEIFKRVLNANGIDDHVEFHWGMPSRKENNERIATITELLSTRNLSETMRAFLERDIARLMKFREKSEENNLFKNETLLERGKVDNAKGI